MIQPQVKTQLQSGSSFCGRHYSNKFERDDTTSGEGTSPVFTNPVFGKQYSVVRKREDTTSGPLDNSVNCSETNVIIMPHRIGECSSLVEAVCSILFTRIVIESN